MELLMAKGVVDIFMVYQFLKRLTTPFNQTDAYKLGLIDAEGKRIKKAETSEERKAVGYFDRLVFNLKRLLGKVPGGKTQLASYAAALLLLREQDSRLVTDQAYLQEQFNNSIDNINMKDYNEFNKLIEDIAAPANATGSAVAGTGSDPIHWSNRQPKMGPKGPMKKYGQPISPGSLRRILKRNVGLN
jgi:hypothetical protein